MLKWLLTFFVNRAIFVGLVIFIVRESLPSACFAGGPLEHLVDPITSFKTLLDVLR